jgi:hypothetical protein
MEHERGAFKINCAGGADNHRNGLFLCGNTRWTRPLLAGKSVAAILDSWSVLHTN